MIYSPERIPSNSKPPRYDCF